jgi:hypothetical protein
VVVPVVVPLVVLLLPLPPSVPAPELHAASQITEIKARLLGTQIIVATSADPCAAAFSGGRQGRHGRCVRQLVQVDLDGNPGDEREKDEQ